MSLTILQKGKKKNEIKKAASSKTQIIEPEDENSGRKPTSQSTQSLSQLVLHLIKFCLPHNDILCITCSITKHNIPHH